MIGNYASAPLRQRAVCGVLAVAVLSLTACSPGVSRGRQNSAGSPSSEAVPGTTAVLPATSPADVAKRQATMAYLGMWQAMARAGETSNWQEPELAHYATGNALTTITRSLYADHFNGVVSRGAPVDHPVVSSVEPAGNLSTARITDCADSTHWLQYHAGTNQLVDGTPGGRRSIVAKVQKQPDGSWKVTEFAVEGLGSC